MYNYYLYKAAAIHITNIMLYAITFLHMHSLHANALAWILCFKVLSDFIHE